MNGDLVGRWQVGRTGKHTFTYEPGWRANPKFRPLSLSLPLTQDGALTGNVVTNYFDNLLPDNEAIRKRLRDRFRTGSADAFSLLEAIGRDCVGAVQLLPDGAPAPDVRKLQFAPLSTADIEAILGGLAAGVGEDPDDDEGFRISIAGAQEKTALLRVGEQWCRPHGSTPTTHILKPPIGITPGRNLDLTLSPENEWLCSRLLHGLGFPVPKCWVEPFGNRRALVVERFDRQWQHDPQWLVRIPQEDMCQVMGLPSSEKYERNGGPGVQSCLRVLLGSQNSERDRQTFLLAQLAFWLLAAIDGHGKNFSVFLLPGGAYRLTPLYDVLSAWPIIGSGPNFIQYRMAKMAMAIRGEAAHYRISEILPRHWHTLAEKSGVPGMWDSMLALVDRVPVAIAAAEGELPKGFPQDMAVNIFDGMRQHAQRFHE